MSGLMLVLLACHGERHHGHAGDSATDTGAADTDPCVDGDGDGYPVTTVACDHGGDCDDTSDTTYPGAPDETRDGVDQDCDGRDGPRVEAASASEALSVSDLELGLIFPARLSADAAGVAVLVMPGYTSAGGGQYQFQTWRWGEERWNWEEPAVVATAAEEQLPYFSANSVVPVPGVAGGGFLSSFFADSGARPQGGRVIWTPGDATGDVSLIESALPTWVGSVDYGWFGNFVQPLGDVRDDGGTYFLSTWHPTGEPAVSSALIFALTPAGGTDADAVTSLDPPAAGVHRYVGARLAGPIDFDGDGVDDVVVATYNDAPNGEDDARGLVSIVPGPVPEGAYYVDELDERWGGTGLYSQLGAKLAVAGDLDNDGLDDLLISADDCGLNDNGTLYALRKHTWILPGGSPEGTIDDVAPAVFAEADDPDIYTDPLYPAGLGDLDGDGHLDVGLGSDNVHDPSFPSYHYSGVVWIASGPFSGTVDLVQGPSMLAIWGAEEEDLNWVSGGDVNGDGLSDVVLSSNDPNAMGTSSAIYTFLSPF